MEGTEKQDGYQPLSVNPQGKVNIKKDRDYIRLQVVEQEIKEYNVIRWYVSVILVTSFLNFPPPPNPQILIS
jgi:hypothetical protein